MAEIVVAEAKEVRLARFTALCNISLYKTGDSGGYGGGNQGFGGKLHA